MAAVQKSGMTETAARSGAHRALQRPATQLHPGIGQRGKVGRTLVTVPAPDALAVPQLAALHIGQCAVGKQHMAMG